MSEPDWIATGLNGNHDVSAALGRAIAAFGLAEFVLVKICGLALGDGADLAPAHRLCGPISSVAKRCDVVSGAIRNSNLTQAEQTEALRWIAEIKALTPKRNDFVHGFYETDMKTGQVRMTTWVLSPRPSLVYPALTAAEIDSFRADIMALVRDISRSLWPADINPI